MLLLAVAVWNVVTFGNFAKNLYSAYESGEDRATGYRVAHPVLIVGNALGIGLVVALVMIAGLRRRVAALESAMAAAPATARPAASAPTPERAAATPTASADPPFLRPVAEPIGQWLLGREIRARIAAFGRACEDPEVLGAV